MTNSRISVFLADDNIIVREGVRALLEMDDGIEVVGVAGDYDGLVNGAGAANPQVVVTDIRMPPTFQAEGIEAAREVRKQHPGTGIVVLSQFDEPEYAISLLQDGASGMAYLLKDRVADGDQLLRAIREVTSGGSMLDPRIVEAMTRPVTSSGSSLTRPEEELLQQVAEGRTIKAIAVALKTTPASVAADVDSLFLKLAQDASTGARGALERLKSLHQAIIDSEEQGEHLSRMLPRSIAERVRRDGGRVGSSERVVVTVLMSDVRGYTTLAEDADPTMLASQLSEHRARMNECVTAEGGTIMQFVGDAVMAVFGAPLPLQDHADHAVAAALRMHAAQAELNNEWTGRELPPFGLGLGVSTGEVAAALLGSEDRLEYSMVGDSVNLTQRLQQWAAEGETVLSEASHAALIRPVQAQRLEPQMVKGRHAPVVAYRIAAAVAAPT
ncbi:MAG: adenylate cyclase [Chloroflexota bacterium]|jgi:class 3 adenylate cyclase/DNA-binding NarL/FixJ family response regulator|nr:adenylate cyclase [Chloroflexota bacterium]